MEKPEGLIGEAAQQIEFLRKIVDVNRSGIFVWDSKGRLVYTNRRAREITGRSDEELKNADFDSETWSITDFNGTPMDPGDLPVAIAINSGESVRDFEHTIRRPAGEVRYLRINGDPILDDAGSVEYVVQSIEDVTESFHTQERLKQTARTFSIAQEAAGFGLWEWHVDRGISFDPQSWRILGYSPEDMPEALSDEQWRSFIHPADREQASLQSRHQPYKKRDSFTVELRYITPEGQYHWVQLRGRVMETDETGSPVLVTGTHVDIHDLKESERRFDQIAGSIQEVFWIRTPEEMLYVNPAYEQVFGRSRESLYENPQSFIDAIHPDDRQRIIEAFTSEQSEQRPFNEEYRIIRPDGEVAWIHAQSHPIHGEPDRSSGIAIEITNQVMAQQALEQRATTDALTRLPNRGVFDSHSAAALSEFHRYGTPASVLVLDVDRFKRVNDTYGHSAGDAVLIEIAARVLTCLRDSDIAARWGGEEFAVLLPHTELAEASIVAERIRSTVEATAFETVGPITVSIGATQMRSDDTDCTPVFTRADHALYTAKETGRNRVVLKEA